MSEETKKDREKILLLSIGRGYHNGKLYHRWLDVTREQLAAGDLPTEDDDRWYKHSKISLTGGVGMVYEVEQEAGSSTIYPGTARFVGRWPDEAAMLRYDAWDRAAKADHDLDRAEAKAKRVDPWLECLAPARDAYRNARGARRNFVLAQIVRFITS